MLRVLPKAPTSDAPLAPTGPPARVVGDLVVRLPFRDEPIADTHGATQMDSEISLVV